MGKRGLGGNIARHYGDSYRGGDRRRCIGCQRTIVYGERCPECYRVLRQRQRRKPR